ncbi:MAG: hypothetical protein ACRD8Z_17280 [Nitrososphaeraceae archaeon]
MIQCSDGEFKKPHGVVLDSKGNVYVSERSGLRIHCYFNTHIKNRSN